MDMTVFGDLANYKPLEELAGERPPAPEWFDDAMARSPEQRIIESEGAALECLIWGEEGRPGLLFLHGGGAQAWWWAHIAPFFADDYRVAAMSMAGMGASDWREGYAIAQHARDMRNIAEAAGLTAAGKPVVIGHSFGGAPTATAAADPERWLSQAIIVDSSLDSMPGPPREPSARRFYRDRETALARWRFMPPQHVKNLYIADMIARNSLVETPEGWSWQFDPGVYAKTTQLDSRAKAVAAQCPLAIVYGDRSWIMSDERLQGMKDDLPDGTPFVEIPDCAHHVMVDQPLALVAAIRALLARA